jgi:hypothetical protein
MSAARQLRVDRVNRVARDCSQIDKGLKYSIAAHAAVLRLEQIIYVSTHLSYMPLDERSGAFDAAIRRWAAQQPCGVADDGQ